MDGDGGRHRVYPATAFDTGEGTRVRLKAHNARYTEAMGVSICRALLQMKTLRQIGADPRYPSMTTITRWLADPRLAAFREMYYHARRVQAELRVDEIFEIADDSSRDYKTVTKADGTEELQPDLEHIQRSRIRIDTRKWYAARLIPRIYGQNAHVDHEIVGDLAELMKQAVNRDDGLPKPASRPILAPE